MVCKCGTAFANSKISEDKENTRSSCFISAPCRPVSRLVPKATEQIPAVILYLYLLLRLGPKHVLIAQGKHREQSAEENTSISIECGEMRGG
jgi:hypothetical protein